METDDRGKKSWRLFLLFVGLALLGSALSAVLGPSCGKCGGAGEGLLGRGRTLAIMGTLYYMVLLGASLLAGPCLPVFAGIQVAAGIHGVLLVVLWQRGQACPLCIGTALSAIAALISSILLEPRNAWRGAYVLPSTSFLFQSWILIGGGGGVTLPPAAQAEVRNIAEQEVSASASLPGRARMVAFVRADCGYCRILEEEVVPALKRDFGDRLAFEPRSAEAMPGMPTPTLILSGQAGRRVFPGLPPEEDLRAAILTVMGESHESKTVLSQSR